MTEILHGRAGQLWAPLAARIRAAYEAGHEVLVLVPEQYTLKAERDLICALKVQGFFRLQVLSPSRFLRQVLGRLGRDPRVVIDSQGRNLSMARALTRVGKDLRFYGSALHKPGFVRKLCEAVAELKGAGISPKDLKEGHLGGQISPKMADLFLIFEAYEALLEGQNQDSEDQAKDALMRLSASDLFRGAAVFVYGFDLLSEPLIRLMRVLAPRASQLVISLVMAGPQEADFAAFSQVEDSARRLQRLLWEANLPCSLVQLPPQPSSRPPALDHLEAHFLALSPPPYLGDLSGLRVYAGKSAYEEARRAAQDIQGYLRSGMDPRDIAVILADESSLALLGEVFDSYNIPHYLSVKEPILGQPLVACLLDALRVIQHTAFRQEDVLRYAKNPFSPLTDQEGWALENYAIAYGIKGKAWTQPLTRGSEEERLAVEPLRLRAMAPVQRLREGLVKARSASASIQAVLDFLQDLDAHGRAQEQEARLIALALPAQAQRLRQVWEQLMNLLMQMNQLLGEQRIPLGQFPVWLSEGLREAQLSALPPQEQTIQVGLMGQLMVQAPRAVYILGLNSQALSVGDDKLADSAEQALLEEGLKTRLGLSPDDREAMKLLDLYKALAQPRESLHLSYALSDDMGKPATPLLQVLAITRMFPGLIVEGGAAQGLVDSQPLSRQSAADEIALMLGEDRLTPAFGDALAVLLQDQGDQALAKAILQAAKGDCPDKRISEQTAGQLFDSRAFSVTRLESYAACPFQHFVLHGLRPQQRAEWAMDSRDLGIFCHSAMDAFIKRGQHLPHWPALSQQESQDQMDIVLKELMKGWEQTAFADGKRAKRRAEDTKNICQRMARSLCEGGMASQFIPSSSEAVFGPGDNSPKVTIALADGRVLALRGTIDRLDVCLDGDLRLVRVVDYKSSQQELEAAQVDAGTQLQLLLYLKAALNLVKDSLPAGAFNQKLQDPSVAAEDEAQAQKKILTSLRLKGVLLADSQVIQLMDGAQPPITMANYIKKDGDLVKNDRLLSLADLQRLIALAEEKAAKIAGDIFLGLVTRAPLLYSSELSSCTWCAFQGVCRRDKLSREPRRRRLKKLSFQELLKQEQVVEEQASL